MNRLRTLVGRCARVLLGAFVLGQVVFLWTSLLTNVEGALGERLQLSWLHVPKLKTVFPTVDTNQQPWFETLCEIDENGLRRYAQLTGQPQDHWSLFAPDVWDTFAFAELELRWDDDGLPPGLVPVYPIPPLTLRSENEPADLHAFLRWGGFRVRKYEAEVTPEETHANVLFGDIPPELRDAWRPAAQAYFTPQHILTYLRWRVAVFGRAHLDLPPPSQVLLWIHKYRIPEPPGPQPWGWTDEGVSCAGRWLPNVKLPVSEMRSGD